MTRALLVQFTKQAIVLALPRALESKSSLVMSHGIAPGPSAKNTMNNAANMIVTTIIGVLPSNLNV